MGLAGTLGPVGTGTAVQYYYYNLVLLTKYYKFSSKFSIRACFDFVPGYYILLPYSIRVPLARGTLATAVVDPVLRGAINLYLK